MLAIRWKTSLSREKLAEALNAHSLRPSAAEARPKSPSRRDPTGATVNQSTTLSWATTTGTFAEAASRLAGNDDVAWTSPVYRARNASGGERSYFAVDPTVLILSSAAANAVDVTALDASLAPDEQRTRLMKGFTVYTAPNGNAPELAGRLRDLAALRGLPNAVSLQNLPYLAPTAGCGCSGGGGTLAQPEHVHCGVALAPHTPNDPLFAQQWGLQRINAPSAWPITNGDPNIVIAVLDQGVDLTHPDLNLWPISYSTITHTYDGSSVGNHGTACAGIIGGKMDNAAGVSGLASGCRVMAISTNFADTEVAEGLYFAADNGARVVSMSFGVYPSWMVWNFAIIEAALQYCADKGVVLVAATGNENLGVARFPATDPRTIGVGGSNRDDVRKSVGDASAENWWGACYGQDVDVVAPCLEIPTTDRLGGLGYTGTDYDPTFNGTSAATPHVAAVAGLILSVNPELSATAVWKIIGETTDKINAGNYVYAPTPGKPYGTWTAEVGYGRINAERALLAAGRCRERCGSEGPCEVHPPRPEPCCVSPCDPPWRRDEQCMIWYENKYFSVPLNEEGRGTGLLQFRVTYEHRMCLLGKQHGPLLFTTTLLPGETIRLYHSERYRRITSTQQRYSVQTTFMQFLSTVHQSRMSNSVDLLNDRLVNIKGSQSASVGGGVFLGIFSLGGGAEESTSLSVTSHTALAVHSASDTFNQSIHQASQLTRAERSMVVSTYEERETQDTSVRTLHNANECRAVTYFVRQVMELYAVATRVSDVSYRILANAVPPDWHRLDDLGWLPNATQQHVAKIARLLPRVGQVTEQPRPLSLPTDGVVYDPELAHCCSCEPERAAAIGIRLEKEKAEALKACLEAQLLQVELARRQKLLQRGELAPFAPVVEPAPGG
ncbi:MAG: S8 family serine peptidase [Opitutae bacterium]|nr:S8 family serine peptidase [Opitutae bacterium]